MVCICVFFMFAVFVSESIMDLHWLLKRLITWNKYILNARVLSLNHGFGGRNICFSLLKVFKDDVLWFDDITAMWCGLLGTGVWKLLLLGDDLHGQTLTKSFLSVSLVSLEDTLKETDGILSVLMSLVTEQIANFTGSLFPPWNKLLISQLTLFLH